MKLLRLFRCLPGWSLALVATAVLGTVAVAVAKLFGGRHALAVARLWARVCLFGLGCRVRVEGREHLDENQRFVIMANHQSALDIPVLLAALPGGLEVSFMAKKSLFGKPFLGPAMAAMGFIPVDRGNRSTAPATFARTVEQTQAGRSVLVFPEETFSPDSKLLPFKRGGFLIAVKTGLAILPIGIWGTRIALPPDSRLFRPTRVVLRIGEALATANLSISHRQRLTEEVHQSITTLSSEAGLPGFTQN